MSAFVYLLLISQVAFVQNADLFEILDKVSSQTYSLYTFATESEENLHDIMHRVVRYFLYTRNGKEVEVYKYDMQALKRSPFAFNKPTVIVIHGYTDNRNRPIIVRLRTALLNYLDANIFVFDWRQAASQIYFTAVTNTYPVGKELGSFLLNLENCGYDLSKIHLIGHSLGAQIAGIAGSVVHGRIGRITGLDPAGPLFEFLDVRNDSLSLDKSDAQFVDVIHSAIGSFGVFKPIGHADFYPNDGLVPQPGCNSLILAVSCSHIRSIDFFVESLDRTLPKYLSKRCVNWDHFHLVNCTREEMVPMGYYTPTSARGSFYVQSNEEHPYGLDGKFFKRTILLTKDQIYVN